MSYKGEGCSHPLVEGQNTKRLKLQLQGHWLGKGQGQCCTANTEWTLVMRAGRWVTHAKRPHWKANEKQSVQRQKCRLQWSWSEQGQGRSQVEGEGHGVPTEMAHDTGWQGDEGSRVGSYCCLLVLRHHQLKMFLVCNHRNSTWVMYRQTDAQMDKTVRHTHT